MYKSIITILALSCLLCYFLPVYSQNVDGVQFQKGLNWDQVREKAKKENKNIFVDCYATWCLPCRQMEQFILSDKSVGNLFNKEFISIHLQFDSTGKDNDEVRKWFSVARKFEKQYNVNAYPTFLFFNQDGVLVDKKVGAYNAADKFVEIGKIAIDTNRQYFTLRNKFMNGNRDKLLILNIVPEAVIRRDNEVAFLGHDSFYTLIDDRYNKENLITIYGSISSTRSKGFNMLLKDTKRINFILGEEDRAQSVIKSTLIGELNKKYISGKSGKINWNAILGELYKKAPAYANEVCFLLKINKAGMDGKWEEWAIYLLDYYDKYVSVMSRNDRWWMNNQIWEVFKKCDNPETLERAAEWSRQTLDMDDGKNSPVPWDTYANLLYKLSKRDEAIYWEDRALEMAKRQKSKDTDEFSMTLKKMKEGIPTWKKLK